MFDCVPYSVAYNGKRSNFLNCPVFIDITQTLRYKVEIEYNQRDVCFSSIVALCFFPISLLGKIL